MRTLDRYLIREILPPFLLALSVFTFVLAVRPMLDYASTLLSKGVPLQTVGYLLMLLLPQALGITIPMAFLTGLLMALGRLSGDREGVALLACGVSPARLLRPVMVLAVVVCGLSLYVLLELVPDSNQTWREITFRLATQQGESDIKPRIFYEGFPGRVVYYRDARPGGGWSGVMLAETNQPGRPVIVLAETGHLNVDRERRLVTLSLENSTRYRPGTEDGIYDTNHNPGNLSLTVDPQAVFGDGTYTRGATEQTIGDLLKQIDEKRAAGLSPHNEIMALHQKFSFPVACLVFGLIGLALGLHTRKEGKLAGLALGLGVIFAYYVLMAQAEDWTKGGIFPAAWARWVPNLVLGPLGALAVWWRGRSSAQGIPLPVPGWLTRRFKRTQPTATAAPRPEPRIVVVIRVPDAAVLRPRLLDLYVSGRYLRMIALAFFGLMALYYIGTFLDLSDKMFKGQATGRMLFDYLWYSTPQFVYFVVPIATLVAVLGTIGGLTRTSELTVMRACGVSLYRTAAPLLALALVWSVILFTLDERVLAQANRKAESARDRIYNRPPRTMDVANRNWHATEDSRLYYYATFERPKTLHGVTLFETATGPYRLVRQTFAKHAVYRNGRWQGQQGWVQTFLPGNKSDRQNFAERTLDIAPPEDLGAVQTEAELMTFSELRAYITRLDASGLSVTGQRVDLYGKIAFPLVTLVMTLIAVPFAVTTGRRGALYGIGLAIMLAVSYTLISTVFVAAGKAGLLPAPLAAWATNVIFMAAAAYMVLTVRT